MALPAVMLGIGLVVGQVLYGMLGSRVGLRRLAACGSLAMLLCAIAAACVVVLGNFWMYCAAKLAMAVPFGMLYSMGYSMPRLARNKELRQTAAGGVKRTDTSAAILGTVLGGYAAQGLGDAGVYALVAAVSVLLIVLVFGLIPKGTKPLEAIAQAEQVRGSIVQFAKAPTVWALAIFILMPATVAAGYASFLFPIFSSDLGLAKPDVNNIVVLGQVVVYACITGIEHLEGRYGRWKVSLVAVALMGVVFLLFSVKTTLVWSVAVIALVGLLAKMADGWRGMWVGAAEATGIPAGQASGAMLATRSLALVAQPFILGALLGATDSAAVTVIGALCLLCAVAFFFATRRSFLTSSQNGEEALAR